MSRPCDKISQAIYYGPIVQERKNNWGRYCAPSPFCTSYRPSGVSDPIKLSTSWFVVLVERLSVWANDKMITLASEHSQRSISYNSLSHRQLAERGGIAGA